MGWTEEQFWKSTLPWFRLSLAGREEYSGGPGSDEVTGDDMDELDRQMAEHEAMMEAKRARAV